MGPKAADDALVRLLERVDWSRTPVGPRRTWPGSLSAALSILWQQQNPAFLFWGPEFVTFYNDAGARLAGEEPPPLGRRARDAFAPVWPTLAAHLNGAYDDARSGVASIGDRNLVYGPVYDGERITGVYACGSPPEDSAIPANDPAAEQALLERFADVMPQMMWISDAHGKRLFQNRSWIERTGYRSLDDSALTVHPDDREEMLSHWKYAVATGTPFAHDYRLWNRGDRRYGWVHGRAQPILERSRIVRWAGITSDIDRRKRDEFAIAFLSNASARLNESLDPVAILREAAQLPLGVFADFAFAYVYRDGRLQRVAAIHADAQKQRFVDDMVLAAGDPQLSEQAKRMLVMGEPMLYQDVDDDTLADWAETPVHAAAMIRGDLRSMIRSPIEVAGNVIGAVSVCRSSDSPRFDTTDVGLVAELTRRVSIALANADIYQREHRIALSFQDAAMPTAIAARPGLQIRGYYVPGRSEVRVGGDWYDAATLPDGRIVFSIGDVSGSGLDAAVVMSMVRPAIRSAAFMHADPARILQATDAVVRADAKDHFVTAFVGILDPVTLDLVFSNAGHPPPIVVAGGVVEELAGGDSVPLGITAHQQRNASHRRLERGSTLLMYTDGLVEGEGAFLPGVDALLRRAASPEFDRDDDPRALYDALLPHGSRDDTALLSVRFDRTALDPYVRRFEVDIETTAAAAHLRERLCDHLMTLGLPQDGLPDARLAIGEVVANVARHAPGAAIAIVDPTTEHIVVHVIDAGPGFSSRPRLPSDAFAESGRGLFIASALSHHFSVSRTLEGGSHIRLAFTRSQ